jgi:UPF0755 protein
MNTGKIIKRIVSVSAAVIVMILVISVIYYLGECAYQFGYRVYTEKAMEDEPGTDVLLTIDRGMSSAQIAQLMEKKGLVRDSSLFLVQLKMSAYSGKIESGTYTLNTSMTPKELLESMGKESASTEEED